MGMQQAKSRLLDTTESTQFPQQVNYKRRKRKGERTHRLREIKRQIIKSQSTKFTEILILNNSKEII